MVTNNQSIKDEHYELTDTFMFQIFRLKVFRNGNVPFIIVHRDRRRTKEEASSSVPVRLMSIG